jgi:hypothetical protein
VTSRFCDFGDGDIRRRLVPTTWIAVKGHHPEVPTGRAPRQARPFVAAFLATLVVCGLAPLNLWPFSNWELFSRLRTDRQTRWEAVAVAWTGMERAYPIASLRHAAVLGGFSKRSAGRDASCAAWLRGATEVLGTKPRLVRIYRMEWLLSDLRGHRAPPRQRTLIWVCTAKGAHE